MFTYFQICSDIFLTLVTSGWQKPMETSGYDMAALESKNNNHYVHMEMYQTFNKYKAIQ